MTLSLDKLESTDGHRFEIEKQGGHRDEKRDETGYLAVVAHSDPGLRYRLGAALRDKGFSTVLFDGGSSLLDWLGDSMIYWGYRSLPDLIVAELKLPGCKGVDLLADVRYSGWSTPFILVDRHFSPRLRREAMQLGSVYLLYPPYWDEEVQEASLRLVKGSSAGKRLVHLEA